MRRFGSEAVVLVRDEREGAVRFFLQRNPRGAGPRRAPELRLPGRVAAVRPGVGALDRAAAVALAEKVMAEDLGVEPQDYAWDQELEPLTEPRHSPRNARNAAAATRELYPFDAWVRAECRDLLVGRVGGEWLTAQDALDDIRVSPTTQAVLQAILQREDELTFYYCDFPEDEFQPGAARRLLEAAPAHPERDALVGKWHAEECDGVRCFRWSELRSILDGGARALNLEAADYGMPLQELGCGRGWSFFTAQNPPELHALSPPAAAFYGVLRGRLEVWWKPSSAHGGWRCHTLGPLDWLEVGPQHCHVAQWVEAGIGVAFRAGVDGADGAETDCSQCDCLPPFRSMANDFFPY